MLWAKNTNSYEFHSYLTWCGLSWGGCGVGRGMVVSIPLYARYMRKSKKSVFPLKENNQFLKPPMYNLYHPTRKKISSVLFSWTLRK